MASAVSCGLVDSLLSDSYWVASCDEHQWRAHPTASRQRAITDLEGHRVNVQSQNSDGSRELAEAAASVIADRKDPTGTSGEDIWRGCGEVIDLLSGVYWLACCKTHAWQSNATSIRGQALLDLERHHEQTGDPIAPGRDETPS